MTQDDIISMAREAGMNANVGHEVNGVHLPAIAAIRSSVPVEWLQRFAALVAAAAQPVAAPDGWQLVPKKPTDAMLCALMQWNNEAGPSILPEYRAMLKAAPQPPAQAQEDARKQDDELIRQMIDALCVATTPLAKDRQEVLRAIEAGLARLEGKQ